MSRLAAVAVCLAVTTACAGSTTPAKARRFGMVTSIAGVVGMMGTALVQPEGSEPMVGFSLMSAGGVITFALAELSDPPKGPRPETEDEKLRRWAKILTQRAAGAAREGRCTRVRRLEKRVHLYNREVHDFVFMRDPAIVRCLDGMPAALPPEDETVAAPRAFELPAPAPAPLPASAPEPVPAIDPSAPVLISPPDPSAPPPVLPPPRSLP
ncbi:MAG: hypothetical protein JWP01_1515 [Myxococcales bacterium]|nr:hypothetical protein [Myxococcales bacterium]